MLEDPDRDWGPRVPPRSLAEPEHAAAARRRTARVAGLAAIVLALGALIVAVVARDNIMAAWPDTVRVYRTFGLVAAPGAGLETSVTQRRTTDSLIVEGDIVNRSTAARPVPPLRVSLRGDGAELAAQIVVPPVATLAPGATAHFTTVFEHPNLAATDVVVGFMGGK